MTHRIFTLNQYIYLYIMYIIVFQKNLVATKPHFRENDGFCYSRFSVGRVAVQELNSEYK